MVAQKAQRFACSINLANDHKCADAKSILDILLLAAGAGTSLKLQTKGKDAELALEQIEQLFEFGYAKEYQRDTRN
jgi:phosphocarrier protein